MKTRVHESRRGRRPAKRGTAKPHVEVIETKDGKIHIINGTQGAEWCGVSQQAFANVVRRYYEELRHPKPETQFERAKRRVRAHYPELFKESK